MWGNWRSADDRGHPCAALPAMLSVASITIGGGTLCFGTSRAATDNGVSPISEDPHGDIARVGWQSSRYGRAVLAYPAPPWPGFPAPPCRRLARPASRSRPATRPSADATPTWRARRPPASAPPSIAVAAASRRPDWALLP